MRDALVLLLLQILHRIIQKEVDQDCVDAVCLVWWFNLFDIFDALKSVLVVILDGCKDALLSGGFDFGVTFLDFALN